MCLCLKMKARWRTSTAKDFSVALLSPQGCQILSAPWASLIAQLVKNPPAIQETPVQFLGRSAREGITYPLQYSWASFAAQLVKNLPAMWVTWVRSLGWDDPLEEGGKGYPLQYSDLENSMDSMVHGAAESDRTWFLGLEQNLGQSNPFEAISMQLLPFGEVMK